MPCGLTLTLRAYLVSAHTSYCNDSALLKSPAAKGSPTLTDRMCRLTMCSSLSCKFTECLMESCLAVSKEPMVVHTCSRYPRHDMAASEPSHLLQEQALPSTPDKAAL